MDKETLSRLLIQLPEDATEIIIKGLDTREVFFCSNYDCSKYARLAQKGSYKGPKTRWRLTDDRPLLGTPVKTDDLPSAETTLTRPEGKDADAAAREGDLQSS